MTTRHMTRLHLLGSAIFLLCLRGNAAPAPPPQHKGKTLRHYNPKSHQWSIYLLDVDKGTTVVAVE
jgi:hypothetical protein